MKIGLLGFGVVGRGVYDITSGMDDIQVAKVVCLEDVTLTDAEVTRDIQSILTDDSIDTVIEAMGGLHPAYEFVRACIEAGKNIVTSNKALVCSFYDELLPLAQEKGVQFRCTAAVGGGIGWLSELERSRRVQPIEQVGGIMNGTCNYILDSMTRLGLGYDEALKQAQALGYAEAKPATDVEGIDTWHKVILSSNIAFGVSLDPATVPVTGISTITAEDVAAFTERGYTCKLISTGKAANGKYSAYVQPTLIPQGQPEAAVPSNYNLITLIGKYSGRMSFFGQGAGRYPTAYNVVQDLVDLLGGVKAFYTDVMNPVKADNANVVHSYYVRCDKENEWLKSVTKESWGAGVLTEAVSLEKMHAFAKEMNEEGAKVFFAGLR